MPVYAPATRPVPTVSVPPTVNVAAPDELVVPVAAEGAVVNVIVLCPLVIEPPVVAMPKLRLLGRKRKVI